QTVIAEPEQVTPTSRLSLLMGFLHRLCHVGSHRCSPSDLSLTLHAQCSMLCFAPQRLRLQRSFAAVFCSARELGSLCTARRISIRWNFHPLIRSRRSLPHHPLAASPSTCYLRLPPASSYTLHFAFGILILSHSPASRHFSQDSIARRRGGFLYCAATLRPPFVVPL